MVSRAELSLSCAELLPPIGGSSILEGSSSRVVIAYYEQGAVSSDKVSNVATCWQCEDDKVRQV